MTLSVYSRRRCQHPPLMYYAFCFVELLNPQRCRRTEHAIRGQTASHLHSAEWHRKANGNETSYQYSSAGRERLQTSQSSRCTWAELVSLSPTVCSRINLSRSELSFYLQESGRTSGRQEEGRIYFLVDTLDAVSRPSWVARWVLVMHHPISGDDNIAGSTAAAVTLAVFPAFTK